MDYVDPNSELGKGYYHVSNMATRECQIIVAKVLVGHYETKKILTDDSKITTKNPATGKTYDSVTDFMDAANRNMFVTFTNDKQYAEYVLTYIRN